MSSRRGVLLWIVALAACDEAPTCEPGTELRDGACVSLDAGGGLDAARDAQTDDAARAVDAPRTVDGGDLVDVEVGTDGGSRPRPTHVPAGAILFFDLSTCPGAWEEVTATDRLLRVDDGDDIAGEEGGGPLGPHDAEHLHEFSVVMGTAHRHTFTFNSTTSSPHAFDAYEWRGGDNEQASPRSHGHGTLRSSMAAPAPHIHAVRDFPALSLPHPADLLPRWREVRLCRATRALTLGAPALALLDADACPPELTEDATLAGRFFRGSDGDGELAESGGVDEHAHDYGHDHFVVSSSDGHTHTFEVPELGPVARNETRGSGGFYEAEWCAWNHTHGAGHLDTVSHTHDLPPHEGDVDAASHVPLYVEVAVCRAESEQPVLPADMVILFEGACPTGWRAAGGGEWQGRYLRARSSPGAPRLGGTAEHMHTGAEHDHGGVTSVGADPGHRVTVPYSAGVGTIESYRVDDGLEFAHIHTHGAAPQTHGRPEPAHTLGSGGFVGPVANEPGFRELTLCEPE